jgi:hypothetical protein
MNTNRKGLLAALLLAVPLASACDGRLVPVTATYDDTFDFSFDSDQSTSEVASISEAEIEDAFDVDPADAVFVGFSIQQFEISLAPGAGNEATSATLRFSYAAQNFTGDIDITVADLDSAPIESLLAAGVTALRNDFEAILANDPGAPGVITVTGAVLNIQPASARLVLDASVTVTATATYETCQETGFGPVGPDSECVAIPEGFGG